MIKTICSNCCHNNNNQSCDIDHHTYNLGEQNLMYVRGYCRDKITSTKSYSVDRNKNISAIIIGNDKEKILRTIDSIKNFPIINEVLIESPGVDPKISKNDISIHSWKVSIINDTDDPEWLVEYGAFDASNFWIMPINAGNECDKELIEKFLNELNNNSSNFLCVYKDKYLFNQILSKGAFVEVQGNYEKPFIEKIAQLDDQWEDICIKV